MGEFQDVKARLDEIADAVENEDMPLDEVLALYEEAVQLGLRACDLSDVDITPEEESAESDGASQEAQPGSSENIAGNGGLSDVAEPAVSETVGVETASA